MAGSTQVRAAGILAHPTHEGPQSWLESPLNATLQAQVLFVGAKLLSTSGSLVQSCRFPGC